MSGLLELAEEFSGEKMVSQKFLLDLAKVRTESDAASKCLSEGGSTVEHEAVVEACLKRLCLYEAARKFAEGCSTDDKAKDVAVVEARDSLAASAKAVCQHHVLTESKMWMQEQVRLLSERSCLTQTPKFAVFRLRRMPGVIGEDQCKLLVGLLNFYDACAELAGVLETVRKSTTGETPASITPAALDQARESATKVCSASTVWRQASLTLANSDDGKALAAVLPSLENAVHTVMDSFFMQSWDIIMETPRAAVQSVVKLGFDKADLDPVKTLKPAIETCNAASFVASGLKAGALKKCMLQATSFTSNLLDALMTLINAQRAKDISKNGRMIKAVCVTLRVLVEDGDASAGLTRLDMSFDENKVRTLGPQTFRDTHTKLFAVLRPAWARNHGDVVVMLRLC